MKCQLGIEKPDIKQPHRDVQVDAHDSLPYKLEPKQQFNSMKERKIPETDLAGTDIENPPPLPRSRQRVSPPPN